MCSTTPWTTIDADHLEAVAHRAIRLLDLTAAAPGALVHFRGPRVAPIATSRGRSPLDGAATRHALTRVRWGDARAWVPGASDVPSACAVPVRAAKRLWGALVATTTDDSRQESLSTVLEEAAGLVGAVVEQKLARRSVQRRTERILDSIAEGVYCVDREGRATFVNPTAATMLGWEREALIGRPTHALVHHSHADGSAYPQNECTMHLAILHGVTRHVEDEVFWRRDGTCFPVAYTTTPLWEDGQLVGAVVSFRDITARRREEERLRSSEERFRTLTAHAPVGIFETDTYGRCTYINHRWSEITGLCEDRASGLGWAAALHPADRERVLTSWRLTIATGEGASSEHRMRRPDGTTVWVVRQAVAMKSPEGRLTGFIGTLTDVTAHRQAQREARTDDLTGLPNRRAFLEVLELDFARAKRRGEPVAMLLLDLDHFKRVNDTHGHDAGDRVLAETARRLAEVSRTGETLARVGGEEFAWLLPDATVADALQAGERARRAIADEAFPRVGSLTISAGASECDPDRDDPADLLRRADAALYRSKHRGRNAVSS